ncbi:ABC-type transporter, periplasmic subunit family 3 [Desulfovibrio sp. X2]|uniref:substrate-binding periplasmic protein n=1 Tax=Desulfovibrio sp. X2 TaxID=941449 RepID=UPI0003589D26|nr:transporter substrate-binding domain-containing protein [Desulfovibrio sp. X2]EPR38717.1 ABC-type transporter, periplasmic subunit family 3 [Desulfovibrio sp. X2]
MRRGDARRRPEAGAAWTGPASLAAGLLAALLLLAAPCRASHTVRLATLNWQPYVGTDLPGDGFYAQVVREALRRSGYTLELAFLPWPRGMRRATEGQLDGIFPAYHTGEREAIFTYSDPLGTGVVGFFALRGRNIHWRTLRDLTPYSIAVQRGYANSEAFDAADYLNKEVVSDDQTAMRMLAAGRVDMMISDERVGQALARRLLGPKADEVVFLQPPLEEMPLYVCFSKRAGRAGQLKAALDAGLASMRADGTLARLKAASGF